MTMQILAQGRVIFMRSCFLPLIIREKVKLNSKISPGWIFGKMSPDPTGELAVKMASLDYKIETVDGCLKAVAPEIYIWLKQCVVDGKSYNSMDVPCGKEYFYTRYKAFFSRLNNSL